MASITSVHTVRKVTVAPVVIVQGDNTETTVTQDNHIMLITLFLYVGQYRVRIATYSSVVKIWFTLRASASALAPDSPILLPPRLWKRVLQN